MKITSIECYKGKFIFLKINTDEGIYGWGEAGLAYGECKEACFANMIDFARQVIGMDPFDTELIASHLRYSTFWGMGGGVTVTAAMAAIDTACWDIKGKKLGVPVYKLLGGKTNDKIRAYASQLQGGWRKAQVDGGFHFFTDPQDYYDAVIEAKNEGYTAFKIDPSSIPEDPGHGEFFMKKGDTRVKGSFSLRYLDLVERRIAACREAAGEDGDILIETHSMLDTNTCIQLAKRLEKYNIMLLEEPTSPANPGLFKTIKQKTIIPLATGERSYSRWGFLRFFEDRSLSIVQPDLCNTGGITETKKICDMAECYDMVAALHICGGPIATAASLQVEATIPNFLIHEEHCANMKPFYQEYGVHCWHPVNGYYDVPDLPGIGEDVPEETLAKLEKVIVQ